MTQGNNIIDDRDFPLSFFTAATPFPVETHRQPTHLPDSGGDRGGGPLLFSGAFLCLVGVAFTVMGWLTSENNWTQTVGPILLFFGVLFIAIAAFKCRSLLKTCCKRQQTSQRFQTDQHTSPPPPAIVFTGITQPITFHGATVLQYLPPPNLAIVAQEGMTACEASLLPLAPPHYYTIFPLDNPVAASEETCPPPYQEQQPASVRSDFSGSTVENDATDNAILPSYDEIFLTSQTRS